MCDNKLGKRAIRKGGGGAGMCVEKIYRGGGGKGGHREMNNHLKPDKL